MAGKLSLVAGAMPRAADAPSPPEGRAAPFLLPRPGGPTLCELFAASVQDGGWCGFLLPQLEAARPLLWVQERMAIRQSGRLHPAGLPRQALIHVEARTARDALWAMEEGLRCAAIGAVIGELWGDPAALDFTATRRLAVAAERSGVACWLVRLSGRAELSGARMRWRLASLPSLPGALDPRAPGPAAWQAELFRARGSPPGQWAIGHDGGAAGGFHRLAEPGDRALVERIRRSA